jgi:hypothetical protein
MFVLVKRTNIGDIVLMSRIISSDLLAAKLDEAMSASVRDLTARDARIPLVPGKAIAVIGVRRGGKTSFMRRRMAERIAAGRPREGQLLIGLEDERLIGMTAADLGWLISEHQRRLAVRTERIPRSLYLDEVQVVAGWPTLVRRLLDEDDSEIFVSGSSAKLLSREVATSLRGRGMEVLIHPFSFRESLRHVGAEPASPWEQLRPMERGELEVRLRGYLECGGFPEAHGLERRDRLALLTSYVDVMVLRDVIERHAVSNPTSLRWLQRQLSRRRPGTSVSSSMTACARRGRVSGNHFDHGLVALYERTGRASIMFHTLETAVLLELGAGGEGWIGTVPVKLGGGLFAQRPGGSPSLFR